VDDLSQEIAARAAGVDLVLSQDWLPGWDLLPEAQPRHAAQQPQAGDAAAGAEILDNPVGTACGFALDIGKARFFFTPGVPRELRRMLEEQIIPRLLARSGVATAIRLKRFHSYGLGESHVTPCCRGSRRWCPTAA